MDNFCAEYDLSQKIIPFLDVHMAFPVLTFLEQRKVRRLDFRVVRTSTFKTNHAAVLKQGPVRSKNELDQPNKNDRLRYY